MSSKQLWMEKMMAMSVLQFLRFFVALGTLMLAPLAALASDFASVTLDPITHRKAELQVIDSAGEIHSYSPAELEQFPTFRVVTTTPWREEPATFDGIMLGDLLSHHGLDTESMVQVIAENDFISEVPQGVWATDNVLIATRVDGKAHTRRMRGPIQFIIPATIYESNPDMREAYLVWMAHVIRPAP